ncbi:MAG: DEAD/DEAH box helicase family protein, partial [Deltaproteobacteria bacterium]|nr:DEAD/DEAH box helicase family protein [Deltaproteobacteria bacterium]
MQDRVTASAEAASPLEALLDALRRRARTPRELGTYFEDLVVAFLRNEPAYADLYDGVWTFAEWAEQGGLDRRDDGIDLVARVAGTGELHAIQCKCFAADHVVQKSEIDSFFTASGKRPFERRIIVTTATRWSAPAEAALQAQRTPVSVINRYDLEQSRIDWQRYGDTDTTPLKPKKSPLPHQQRAIADCLAGLATAERGKLIMACGTGKTFTSLRIAEAHAGGGGRVLFLVPSLALLSQALTEWTQQATLPLHAFAVCSDADVGKRREGGEDVELLVHELRYPATTKPRALATAVEARQDADHLTVIFATYHSIEVVVAAQHAHGMAAFDLVVCDEAHRTTGVALGAEEESAFVRIHDAAGVQSAKRLYMTATPRIFGDGAKLAAGQQDVALCSMDDAAVYGETLYSISFSEAVEAGLLVDYKVLVLAIDEAHVSRRLQRLMKDDDSQIRVEDAGKIVGCWKALAKQDQQEALPDDPLPMRRAVAFCQVIEPVGHAGRYKVSSKRIAAMFERVVEAYKASHADEDGPALQLRCEADHVDGTMNA